MKNIIYMVMVLLCSCQDSISETVSSSSSDLGAIELVDTFTNNLRRDTASMITKAEFHPMYIGATKDSIRLSYWSAEIENRFMYWKRYRRPKPNDLKINVNPIRIIGSVRRFIIPPPPPEGISIENDEYQKERTLFRGETESHPIIIKNIADDTLNVGYGEYIPLIIEAKDSTGNWRPIQEPFIYICGTGLTNFFLPPDEIVITSCKLYEGEYKTKMRVRFGFERGATSNEFSGRMNYQQFNELATD